MSNALFSENPRLPRLMQKSFEWYTPPKYLIAAREVMGGEFDLDPASNDLANRVVCATRFYSKASDGLLQSWEAQRLWLNPPYCKSGAVSNQELWTCKLLAEYEAGRVHQAMLLVNAATETRWFQRLYDFPICFVKGRIRFRSPTGIETGPTVGSAFVYFGLNIQQFITVFHRFGAIVLRPAPLQALPTLWDSTQLPK
jgi:phage N-6-adenine-methyltransferase